MPTADPEQLEWLRFRVRRANLMLVIGVVLGLPAIAIGGIASFAIGAAADAGCMGNCSGNFGAYFLCFAIGLVVLFAFVILGTVTLRRARRDLAEVERE